LNHTILIYHPTRAQEYAELLRPMLPNARLLICATPAEAAPLVPEAQVLFSWRFPPALFPQARQLAWVQSMGAGVEDLVAAPVPAGCTVTRVEGLFGSFMSEYAFAHMLAHSQQLPRLQANQQARRWEPFQAGRLAGKRLGVAGAGSIGEAVAGMGKAFGMAVWALVREARPIDGVDRVFLPGEARTFTAGVDYLVSSLPLTPATVGLIDPREMKPGSLLINVGRGATIDEGALLTAVRSGRMQAVLDVFAHEPLPAEHPFWATPGITVTPHISGPSIPAEVAEFFAANYRRFTAGLPLVGLVDRQRGY
jgi:glyoxylate/hydroxypyruvate reductase A